MKNFEECFNKLTNIFEMRIEDDFSKFDERTAINYIFDLMVLGDLGLAMQIQMQQFLHKENFDCDKLSNLYRCLQYLLAEKANEHDIRNMLHMYMNKDEKTTIDKWVITSLKVYLWLCFGLCKNIDNGNYLYTKQMVNLGGL